MEDHCEKIESERRRRDHQRQQDKKRQEAMSKGYAKLRASLPHIPRDTKLTKLRTLRTAIEYIRYLESKIVSQGHSYHPPPAPLFPQPKNLLKSP